ncbi:MAG: hypothetical protein OXQ29_06665 [Rhodospirillaceae bacterium]|nr:hypothetical protein [Rhodospirillaceae bacterium]
MEGVQKLLFYEPGDSPGDDASGAPMEGTPILHTAWGEPLREDGGEAVEGDQVSSVVRKGWRVRRLGLSGMSHHWWMIDTFFQRWKINAITDVPGDPYRVKMDVHCELVIG